MAISWASVSPTSGDGDGTVKVTVDANSDTSSSRTGTLTFTTTSGLTATLNITQTADSVVSTTYSTPTVTLTVADIAASGGTVSSGTVTYTQTKTVTYASGNTETSTITSGGTVTYSDSVTASSLGTTVKSRTSVGTLTATVTLNGKSGSATATVYQAANALTSTSYGTPSVSLSYSSVAAAGGSVSPTMSYTQTVTYTYTSGSTSTSTVTSGGTATYSLTSGTSYASIVSSTGVVTVDANTTENERTCSVLLSVEMNGETGYGTYVVTQSADSIVSTVTTYSDLSIDSFYYGDETPLYISADAAEYSPTLVYSQTAKTVETYLSGSVVETTATISSGATVTYSIAMSTNGQSVDSSTGVLTIPEFAETSGSAAVVVRATVVLNDESASATATVVQSATEVTTVFYNSDKEEVSQFTFGSISSAGTCATGMDFWADGGSSLSLDSDCATLTYTAATDVEAGSAFDWYGEIVYSGGGSTIRLTPVGGTTTTYINIGTLSILDSDSTVLNSCSVYYDGFEVKYYNTSGNQITSLSVSAAEYYDIGVKAVIRNGGTSTSTSSDVIGAIPDNYGVSWSTNSVSSSTYDYVLRLTPVAGAYDTSTTVRATEFVGSSYTVYSAFTLPVTWNYNRKISFAGTDLGSSFTYSGSTYTSSLSYTITATLNVVADVDLTIRIYYKYYIVPDGTAASTYTTITIAAGDLSGTASVSHTGSGSYSSGSSLLESPYIEFYSAMLTSTYGGTITFSY